MKARKLVRVRLSVEQAQQLAQLREALDRVGLGMGRTTVGWSDAEFVAFVLRVGADELQNAARERWRRRHPVKET